MHNIYDLNILDKYVEKGLLKKAEDEDLVQYNYTEYTNNEHLWDDITIFNRGNIYEKSTGKLIARSMPKFMNIEQLPEEQQDIYFKRAFTTTEKLDGCLGILYKYKGKIRYNSRGSFNNHVTDVIDRLLPKYYLLNHLLEYNTIIVEVISPETKIICNYGNEESLNIITSYNTKNWLENNAWSNKVISDITKMPIVKSVEMNWEQLLTFKEQSDWQKEGFVLCFDNGNDTYDRVKVKSNNYLRVAAFKANLNLRSLWKTRKIDLEQGTDNYKQLIQGCPDELAEQCKELCDILQEQIDEHISNINKLNKELLDNGLTEMKQLGLYFKQNPSKYQHAIFCLRQHENPNLERYVIKMVEPKVEE